MLPKRVAWMTERSEDGEGTPSRKIRNLHTHHHNPRPHHTSSTGFPDSASFIKRIHHDGSTTRTAPPPAPPRPCCHAHWQSLGGRAATDKSASMFLACDICLRHLPATLMASSRLRLPPHSTICGPHEAEVPICYYLAHAKSHHDSTMPQCLNGESILCCPVRNSADDRAERGRNDAVRHPGSYLGSYLGCHLGCHESWAHAAGALLG